MVTANLTLLQGVFQEVLADEMVKKAVARALIKVRQEDREDVIFHLCQTTQMNKTYFIQAMNSLAKK